MNRVVRIILLAFISVTTLSGCLVEKKDLVEISSKTGNLHVYQPGEYIDYFVTATTTSVGGGTTVQTGTLHISWQAHAGLDRPGAPVELIPVVKEVTKLFYDGGSSLPPGTVRFISQEGAADTNPGQMTIHAINDSTGETGWLHTDDITGFTDVPTESFIIFESPLSVGLDQLPVSFHVMENCDITSGVCSTPSGQTSAVVGQYSDDMATVGNTTPITTSLGIVTNPFQISFSGTTIPSNGFPIIDVRNVCGTTTTTHAGTMYVLPELGVIRMTNTCDDIAGGGRVFYDIRIRSTNIPLP